MQRVHRALFALFALKCNGKTPDESAEYAICFVLYHREELSAHQSHFYLRVIPEDRGFQSDVSDIQTETKQICQAALREWGNHPTYQRFPDGSCSNPERHPPHAALSLPPMCA